MYGRLTSLPTGFRLKTNGSLVRLPYTDLKSDPKLGKARANAKVEEVCPTVCTSSGKILMPMVTFLVFNCDFPVSASNEFGVTIA